MAKSKLTREVVDEYAGRVAEGATHEECARMLRVQPRTAHDWRAKGKDEWEARLDELAADLEEPGPKATDSEKRTYVEKVEGLQRAKHDPFTLRAEERACSLYVYCYREVERAWERKPEKLLRHLCDVAIATGNHKALESALRYHEREDERKFRKRRMSAEAVYFETKAFLLLKSSGALDRKEVLALLEELRTRDFDPRVIDAPVPDADWEEPAP